MSFRVDLDIFRGPLDLLLYLVRKHEMEITEIPIAAISAQYCEYLEVLEQLDINAVGDFLEMASTLVEIKSRMVLPRGGEEEEEFDDPRDQLVERLLEYKKYKDAASMLEEQSRQWQQRYARIANDLPPREISLADQPIQQVELWDLVSAFGRIMRESQITKPSNIVYDDTPIQVYMERIHGRLKERKRATFSEMFDAGMHKSAMIGVFLAILELVRHHDVTTRQTDPHGEIEILPGQLFNETLNLDDVDDYNPADSNPADSNPADSNPADSNPADSNPADSNPADSNPADSNPAESNPAESGTNPAESGTESPVSSSKPR